MVKSRNLLVLSALVLSCSSIPTNAIASDDLRDGKPLTNVNYDQIIADQDAKLDQMLEQLKVLRLEGEKLQDELKRGSVTPPKVTQRVEEVAPVAVRVPRTNVGKALSYLVGNKVVCSVGDMIGVDYTKPLVEKK